MRTIHIVQPEIMLDMDNSFCQLWPEYRFPSQILAKMAKGMFIGDLTGVRAIPVGRGGNGWVTTTPLQKIKYWDWWDESEESGGLHTTWLHLRDIAEMLGVEKWGIWGGISIWP